MKRLQLQRWSGTVLSPRTCPTSRIVPLARLQSTASSAARAEDVQSLEESPVYSAPRRRPRNQLPSPPVQAARESAKLAALHARLGLPARLPYETLARTLVDASADPNPKFNNESLASLGQELLAYYTSEHLICTFPRLPMTVMQAAMYAYVGPKSLSAMAREWGVELAAAPGGEVDAGMLQFKRVDPGSEVGLDPSATTRPRANVWRKSISSGVVYDDIFGDPAKKAIPPSAVDPRIPDPKTVKGVTAEEASATFVRALMGAIYLHAGRPAAKRFFREHFLSRHLDISKLFQFVQPTRDLGRLCAREGFEHPVARIISETGRLSRHPVYVVGIFSGKDKLGEGTGGSLAEARTRAAVAALKGWYLYSPLQVRVPSSTEEEGAEPWKPVYVDLGEVIV
ncbi:hypothetical protein VTN49DRAFT_852 [Thermomyces lanuginosus]|uniref:mitochondrial 54S ribosomal protein mL44 n=1 Tax=Thermomyces lanuginosus TaxID=5541 RepID=UPI003743EA55